MNSMPRVFVVIEPYLCLHRSAIEALVAFMQARDVTVSCVEDDCVAGLYKVRLFAGSESQMRRILREWAMELRLPRNIPVVADNIQ